jgi:hypothetical protein
VRRLLPVLLGALALAAAGCGDDNKASNAYVEAVNKAQNDFAATFDRLSSRITSTSTPDQDRKTLAGFKGAVDEVVTDLRAIEAPGKVKPLHQRLVAEIAAYGTQIDRAKRAFASRNPRTIARAQTQLRGAITRVSSQINRTIDQINAKLRE